METTIKKPAFSVRHSPGLNPVAYKHKIVPIKCGDIFIPNIPHLEEIRKTSLALILDKDFIEMQEQGKTIIINYNGGWCYLYEGCEIIY